MITAADQPHMTETQRQPDFRPIMHMTWHDLLFAHWPIPPEVMQALLPRGLTVDTFDTQAWLGIVPFRMTGIRLRGLRGIPTTHAFVELNVRTYVRVSDLKGVYFFSLDAPHRLPNAIARATFHLNYQQADMRFWKEADVIAFRSMRRTGDAMFVAQYHPTTDPKPSTPGTLAHFLTERYRMFMAARPRPRKSNAAGLWSANIHHAPWQLSEAEAAIDLNTMTAPLGLELQGPPLLHYARHAQTQVGPPHRVCDPRHRLTRLFNPLDD